MQLQVPSPLQALSSTFLDKNGIELWVKRDDSIHPVISGNKWRKLKWNIEKAVYDKRSCILTFGGAYSNHIAATAAVCNNLGIKSIGVIRGERTVPLNKTLEQAEANGMHLHFVSRSEYGLKTDKDYLHYLNSLFGNAHVIPEGGANFYGVQGCVDILKEIDIPFDYIATACGTGTTLSGLSIGLGDKQKVLAFPALKGGDFLRKDVQGLLVNALQDEMYVSEIAEKIEWITEYHFGGFGKTKPELVDFANQFYKEYKVPLDLLYTAKMCFGLFQMIDQGYFKPGSKIVVLHTGGLQGNQGFKDRLGITLDY